MNAFRGRIARFRFRFFYAVGMLIVGCAMILLPLVYLAMIAAVIYGLYYHARYNTWIGLGMHAEMRSNAMPVAVYLAPYLFGPLIILFMLKPLFARRAEPHEPLTLDRSQDPLLYDVLERLCATIGAPMPREIEVDVQLNAAACFYRGVWGFFSRQMSLVIGLPLAAGLTLDQFMGIIAHELGHFSQGFGMRMWYVIRGINEWFARVVYERDAWDVWLASPSRARDIRLLFLPNIVRLGIWLNRRVLWLLMFAGHCISCAFSRQMEYDADRVAMDVVGAESVAAALRQLPVLLYAEGVAHQELSNSWRANRLPDNLPLMIAALSRSITGEQRSKIVEHAMSERSGIVSTHPTLARRLRAVERRGSEGVFSYDAPATALFANFKMIANAVTLTHYRRGFGLDVKANNLFATEELIREQAQTTKDVTSSMRYFAGCHHFDLPPVPGEFANTPPADPRASIAELKNLRTKFDAGASEYAESFQKYVELQKRLRGLHAATYLNRAGFKRLDKRLIGMTKPDELSIAAASAEVTAEVDRLMPKLTAMRDLIRQRLTCALQLACVPAVAAKLRLDEPAAKGIGRLLPILRLFESNSAKFPGIARDLSAATAIIRQVPEDADVDNVYPMLLPVLKRLVRESRSELEAVRFMFEGVAYPWGHASGAVSVAEFLACRVPSDVYFVDVLVASRETLDRLIELYGRCLGHLVFIAERVERAVGLPVVEAPSNAGAISSRR